MSYIVQIFHKTRPSDSFQDLREEKHFLTAAGLLRYVRKTTEHYPKDPRTSYRVIKKVRAEARILFSF